MHFGILGPVEVFEAGQRLDVGAPQHRVLLARLLLSPNRVVAVESLLAALWEDSDEANVRSLRVYVSRLRKILGGDDSPLVTQPPGYVLRVGEDALDADRFRRLAAEGRDLLISGDAGAASDTLRRALELWRGPALGDVRDREFARSASVRLEEEHRAVLEDRVDADLALGRHAELAGELVGLTHENPERERLWRQRMLAEYRSGQPASALRTFQELRSAWREDLGLEPGPETCRLERAILEHEAHLEWVPPASVASSAPVDDARSEALRVMLVDDHPLWRSAIVTMLRRIPRFEVVAEADDGPSAIESAAEHRPDVVLMDLHLPGCTGAEAAARITGASADTKVLMLSASGDEHDVLDAVRAGACGYLLKSGDADDIVDALDRVGRGEAVFAGSLAALLLDQVRHDGGERGTALTTRQRDVLRALAETNSLDDVGGRLGLDRATVENEVAVIVERLHASDRSGAVGRLVRTIVFADIVSSTEHASEMGDRAWGVLLERVQHVMGQIAAGHDGLVVKHIGDGSLVTFEQPAKAVGFCRSLLHGVNDLGLAMRLGVHIGECEVGAEDVHGMAVHIAARVQAKAQSDEILVSQTVRELMIGSEQGFEDRGEHDLKGVQGRWRLFALAP